jgi:NADH:ubiquinone oxidoreductase subunit H
VDLLIILNNVFLLVLGLVYCIILMLLSTLIIAALTLVERKFLSLIQRRVGPNFVGYRGRLQYIADALKLLSKGTLIPDGISIF